MEENVSPAVAVSKQRRRGEEEVIVTLADGRKAKLHPVSTTLMQEVLSRIPAPKPPMWTDPEKGFEEPNPEDPAYIEALAQHEIDRNIAAMDAMVMFGIELIDGLPEDDIWLKKLKAMDRKGMISLEGYDLDDEIDIEFLYLRYIATDLTIIEQIGDLSGTGEEEIKEAEASFPGDTPRG